MTTRDQQRRNSRRDCVINFRLLGGQKSSRSKLPTCQTQVGTQADITDTRRAAAPHFSTFCALVANVPQARRLLPPPAARILVSTRTGAMSSPKTEAKGH